MRILYKKDILIIIPDGEELTEELSNWADNHKEHIFNTIIHQNGTLCFNDLGVIDEVIQEPVKVFSNSKDENARLISNLAKTPFELDGRNYVSVEGFWQGLKFEDEVERIRIAGLFGNDAKSSCYGIEQTEKFEYNGRIYRSGCYEHWKLMEKACLTKFSTNEEAKIALLSTNNRPIVHIAKKDSKTIPGVIMADIWMKIRKKLQML